MNTDMHFSELATLTSCERKHYYRYILGQQGKPTGPMLKGTLLHLAWGAWWQGFGRAHIANIMADFVRENDADPKIAEDAAWLMERYITHYEANEHQEMVVMEANELTLTAKISPIMTITGTLDGLVRDNVTGQLYVAEFKTMKDWRRLNQLTVDPQITLYYYLAKANGYDVVGVMYDALKTYRWVRDERPVSESVDRLWLGRSDEQANQAVAEVAEAIRRRHDIVQNNRLPLRNMSSFNCGSCDYKDECYEDLAFPQSIEIVED